MQTFGKCAHVTVLFFVFLLDFPLLRRGFKMGPILNPRHSKNAGDEVPQQFFLSSWPVTMACPHGFACVLSTKDGFRDASQASMASVMVQC